MEALFRSPIVAAPIAGPGTPELAAAASFAGAFGILGCPYRSPEQILADGVRMRELTDRPFGMNLFAEPASPDVARDVLEHAYAQLRPFYDALGETQPPLPSLPAFGFDQQLEAVIAARPALFSFTFGIPSNAQMSALREAGISTMGTATTVEEAVALEAAGVDFVCVQGAEAGGHRGTFMGDYADALIGTIALVPQVVDAVRVPVVAAGGITDGRGVAAVLALGAIAAQCGTAFLLSHEAATAAAYRDVLRRASSRDTVVTQAFSGRAARGVRNAFSESMRDPSLRAPYPYQNALTRDLRTRSAAHGNAEHLSLWAGQAFRLAVEASVAEIVGKLEREAGVALRQAQGRLG